MLQKEIEIVKYNSNGATSPNSFNNTRRGKHDLDNDVWQSHTTDMKSPRRGQSKHLIKTLQAEVLEIKEEKKHLLALCEKLEKELIDSKKDLEDSKN